RSWFETGPLDKLRPFKERGFIDEVDGGPVAAADRVTALAGDGRAVLRIDEFGEAVMLDPVESPRQHPGRQVAQGNAELLEDALGVALLIDVFQLAAPEAGGEPWTEQPAVESVQTTQPRRAHVRGLLNEAIGLRIFALRQPLQELGLFGEHVEGKNG